MPDLSPLHVEVKFGYAIPPDIQGPAVLAFERELRRLCPGLWIEILAGAILSATGGAASAHHFSAMFDAQRPKEISGTGSRLA
jgi:hypothetical protein